MPSNVYMYVVTFCRGLFIQSEATAGCPRYGGRLLAGRVTPSTFLFKKLIPDQILFSNMSDIGARHEHEVAVRAMTSAT